MIRTLLIPFLAAVSLLLTGVPAQAETSDHSTILVLDASGSMWGQIEGTHKITIAKNVVSDLLKDSDPLLSLGLMAYGHRVKGDCEDIEYLVPADLKKTEDIRREVNEINPKGKTPLAESVRRAANELKFEEEPATVILVSDGIETCGGDPCELAKELKARGVNFTAHVVGFDLSAEEQQKIRCIADNTGGKFLSASDADSLKASLKSAIDEVQENDTGVRLIAVTEPGGDPVTVNEWSVFKSINDDRVVENSHHNTPVLYLEPGNYVASVRVQKAGGSQAFSVKKGTITEVEVLIPEQGEVALTAVHAPGAEPVEVDEWVLFAFDATGNKKDSAIDQSYSDQPVFTLLPGRYLVSVTKEKVTHEQEIIVEAGRKKHEEIVIALQGELTLRAVDTPNGEPLDIQKWTLFAMNNDGEKQGRPVDSSYNDQPVFTLLPGRYLVSVTNEKVTHEQEIVVEAGKKKHETVLIAQQGTVQLAAIDTPGGAPVDIQEWEIYEVDAAGEKKRRPVDSSYSTQPVFTLKPGRYVASVRKAKVSHEEEVLIEAGRQISREILIPQQGVINLTAIDTPGGEALDIQEWEIFEIDENGKKKRRPLDSSYNDEASFTLLPGFYIATVRKAQVTHEEPVEVLAGKKLKKELLIPEQGTLSVYAVKLAGGEPIAVHEWEVFELDDNGERKSRALESSYRDQHTFTLLPGTYVVLMRNKNRVEVEQTVSVLAGKNTRLEVVDPG